MARTTVWEIVLEGRTHKVFCELKGNKYILYLGDDHLTNVYRLPTNRMRYGMEEDIVIGSERCKFIVWDEIPDLVIRGHMVNRDTDYSKAKEARRSNMEMLYTVIAVFGLVLLAGVFVFAYLGQVNSETLRGWTSFMAASLWMIGMGLWYRGKWINWD